jgi:hypothetical protein
MTAARCAAAGAFIWESLVIGRSDSCRLLVYDAQGTYFATSRFLLNGPLYPALTGALPVTRGLSAAIVPPRGRACASDGSIQSPPGPVD